MADTIVQRTEELQERDQLRRELIAGISHDLRGPLASIRGYLELIIEEGRSYDSGQLEQDLKTVYNSTMLQSKLIDDLFELSKLEAKDRAPNLDALSLRALAEDAVSRFRPAAENAGVSLRVRGDSELPFVLADITMITRVFSNLVENAIRHTPRGGEVAIALSDRGSTVEAAVRDTGTGIPEEAQDKIFERFYQAEGEAAQKHHGAGLGLAITRKILSLHNAQLRVESAVDQGTTFSFALAADEE